MPDPTDIETAELLRDVAARLTELAKMPAELSTLRDDFRAHRHAGETYRALSESRYKDLSESILRVAETAKKAVESAYASRKHVTDTAQEAERILEAVQLHGTGIGARFTAQDTQLAALLARLADLAKAEERRADGEKIAAAIAAAAAAKADKQMAQLKVISAVAVAVVGAIVWILTHVRVH